MLFVRQTIYFCSVLPMIWALSLQLARPAHHGLYMLHISKCAGESTTLDLPNHTKSSITSSETCWGDHRIGNSRIVTILRNPRSHVISQYYHCDMCAHTPNRFFHPQNWPHHPNLTGWLTHWVSNMKKGSFTDKETFHCYNPINLQVRQLSCKKEESFCPGQDDRFLSDPRGFEGSLSIALNNLQKLAYIGIVEFYQESICLIHVQELGEFPSYCNCRNKEAWQTFIQHHVDHGVQLHPDLESIPQSDFRHIDKLTSHDLRLYNSGMSRFMADLQQVEQRFNKKILCDDSKTKMDKLLSAGTPVMFRFDDLPEKLN